MRAPEDIHEQEQPEEGDGSSGEMSGCAPLDEPDPSSSSADCLDAQSISKALEECLDELPPHVRAAVRLRYEEGLSYEEMSRICEERPATLQARVARALPLLRRSLEGRGIEL
jgi:RNA polymerase sigma-70 factor (ECF subfamily)